MLSISPGNRLFMVMEVDETYTPERKEQLDVANPLGAGMGKIMSKFPQNVANTKMVKVELDRYHNFFRNFWYSPKEKSSPI